MVGGGPERRSGELRIVIEDDLVDAPAGRCKEVRHSDLAAAQGEN